MASPGFQSILRYKDGEMIPLGEERRARDDTMMVKHRRDGIFLAWVASNSQSSCVFGHTPEEAMEQLEQRQPEAIQQEQQRLMRPAA